MSDYVQAWRDACQRIAEKRFGTMSEELKFTVDLTGREMYNIVIALNHEWQTLADRAIQMGQDRQEDLDQLNALHSRLVGVMLAEED